MEVQKAYEIMSYINLNLFENITLDMLSDEFSYSKFYLHRAFKEITGETINSYIRRKKIENSIYFLFANPNDSISEIAGYNGFSSATYSREFRRVFGRTPKEWRNIYKKQQSLPELSKICKNYDRFLCYDDNGIPNEIKKIGITQFEGMTLAAKIFFGNYYSADLRPVWEEIQEKNMHKLPAYGIPLDSPAVTDINKCLYLLGFQNDTGINGLTKIAISEGRYLNISFCGKRVKLGEVYTWIMKFYMPLHNLKYDYHPQLQKYESACEFAKEEISCELYIPIMSL